MRTITTTSGLRVNVDDHDVLAVIEAVSRELTRRSELESGSRTSIANSSTLSRSCAGQLNLPQGGLFMSFNHSKTVNGDDHAQGDDANEEA